MVHRFYTISLFLLNPWKCFPRLWCTHGNVFPCLGAHMGTFSIYWCTVSLFMVHLWNVFLIFGAPMETVSLFSMHTCVQILPCSWSSFYLLLLNQCQSLSWLCVWLQLFMDMDRRNVFPICQPFKSLHFHILIKTDFSAIGLWWFQVCCDIIGISLVWCVLVVMVTQKGPFAEYKKVNPVDP